MKNSFILVLNAGSSSLKFGLFEKPEGDLEPRTVHAGQIEAIGRSANFVMRLEDGTTAGKRSPVRNTSCHQQALTFILEWLDRKGHPISSLSAVGHRVVHGGPDFSAPVTITRKILAELSALMPLAPHHLPHNLGVINSLIKNNPGLPQIASFDTAFHATQSELETRLSLPESYWQRGIRRYGFHGLNYQHVLHELPRITGAPLPGRILIAHLGNGASMCAVRDGKSVSTSMGFSTLDGLVMATRSGNIDPGVLLYLMRTEGCDLDCLEDLLYNKSGLLGLSGTSGDMRELTQQGGREAAFAIKKYCHSAAREAAMLISTLGGVDTIIFTGGIGENAPKVRASILNHFKWLDIFFDENANINNQPDLAAPVSTANIRIIPANEESVIARQTYSLLAHQM